MPFANFAQNAASANRLGTASEADFLKISGGSCIKYLGLDIAICPAGTYTASGGGTCPAAYFLRISNFTDTAVNAESGWAVRCENSAGTYIQADEVKVLCMKY